MATTTTCAEADIRAAIAHFIAAYNTGNVRLTPRSGGAEVVLERRYVELWRHEEGLWRVARTMDNVG